MWIELKDISKKYYEDNKKYINKVMRNNEIGCELNVVSIYDGKLSSHMISLYSLKDTPLIIKNFGPTKIQFFVENKKQADEIVNYLKLLLDKDIANINKIYSGKYSEFILK